MEIIKKYPELCLGGSTIIETINNESFPKSDIDIFLDYSKFFDLNSHQHDYDCIDKCKRDTDNSVLYIELYDYLTKFDFYLCSMDNISYDIEFCFSQKFYNEFSYIVNIVAVPYSFSVRTEQSPFFTFCNNYYDGKTFYAESLDSIVNKWGV
ncbi:hypothetical protein Catovirus_1_384 [Catovirus CTV1]|uniref:Uncharacterized protein n=1 Tax=Catovirus CTV1 TaxID=1977631 RepID=A0A1V0S9H2_9VIRU|nr:hypothetical protein Catovirus_1_384 [Catovirus CTV1]